MVYLLKENIWRIDCLPIERGNYTVLFSFQGKSSSKRIPALFIGLAKGEAV